MKRDETARSNLLLFAVFLIPVVWAALLTAPYLSGGLPEILENLTVAMNNPFHIQWVDDSFKCILIFVVAYGMGIGIYLSTKRNYRHREEHGSARWGGAAVVNKKYRSGRQETQKKFECHGGGRLWFRQNKILCQAQRHAG